MTAEKPQKANFTSVDQYISTFPEATQKVLQEIRVTIRAAAPDAEEKISYQMPTFAQNGVLAHFAAWKSHIGFYATPSANESFATEIAPYAGAKGSLQFPLDQPMPLDLIARMVKYNLDRNMQKKDAKKTGTTKKVKSDAKKTTDST